jgi:7-keto-8-aminopelargonate synthetase-like enzyme
MQLEARLAKFFGAEEGIIYSSGYATMPAVIPTFSGRGDLIVAYASAPRVSVTSHADSERRDAGVHHGIKIALELSRAEIIWFSHNSNSDAPASAKLHI